MSSEEEDTTEQCFELFGDDKSTSLLLNKKQHQNINNNNIINNCANNSNNSNNNLNNKRNRQRVDAGEPRNSYSSIPNFSSRPSATALMSGGLYGAIFSQQNSHANANSFGGLFPNGYGPAKMLNELLGRQVKQAQDANGNTNNNNNNNNNNSVMMNNGGSEMIESANNNSVKCEFDSNTNNVNNTSTNNSPNTTNNNNNNNNNLIRRPTSGANNNLDMIDDNLSTSPQSAAAQANDLAHHMLRNILQGKKDLLALDQELRAVSNGQLSPDGQQKITKNNNNNNLIANNNNLMSNNNNYDTKSDSGTMVNGIIDGNCSNSDKDKENCGTKNNNGDDHTNVECQKLNKDEISENIDDDCIMNSIGDSEPSLASPGGSVSNVKLKEECMDGDMDKDMCRSPSPSPSASNKSDQMDMKRARVENIVSGMHSSPVLGGNASSTPIVNGCKKRKLYHPQQHDNSAVERYAVAAAGLSMGLNLHNLMLNDDDDEDELGGGNILQKRVEKNVLKSQLRSMQEQLAEMQQKYVQLCNRMEQNSDTNPEDDDGGSDLDGDDMMRDNVSDKPSPSIVQRTPTASPNKDLPKTPAAQVSHAQTMLNQVMSKMMSAKLHGHLGAHPSMPSPFNGAHPLLQHMQQQNASNDGQMHPQMQHPAFSNAAAMYLSQKLLMEQEARLREKESEERQQQQHQMQQQIQQQQQQMAQKQQELAQKQQQELMQQHQQAQAQAAQNASQAMHQMQQQQQQQQQQSQIPPIKTSPQSQQQQRDHQSASNKQSQNVPADLSDRLSMMRSSNNNLGPVSGQDLEGLADILKTEINASLSTLVDSIVSRFVHQRRIMGKQSEAAAAAADQLNKDLLMASQILDRKTPRSKQSAERGSGPGLTNQQHPGSNNMNAVNQLQSGNGQQLSNNNNSSNNNNNTNNNHLHHNHHHPAPVNPLMNHMPNTQDMISQHQQQLNQNSSNNNNNNNNNNNIINNNNNGNNSGPQRMNGQSFGPMGMGGPMHGPGGGPGPDMQSQMNQLSIPSHVRPSPTAAMFQGPSKGPQMNSVAAAALYNSISAMNGQPPNGNNPMNPFYMPEPKQERANEQNEALSLVVTPKKKRHKVTDTRITPRTVSRILAQDALAAAAQQSHMEQQQQQQQQQLQQQNNQNSQQNNGIGGNNNQNGNSGNPMMNGNSGNKSFNNSPINVPASIPNEMPSPRSNFHHPPPSMLPVSLPTSVAIPNPSLHESQVFSPYSPFFNPHGPPHGPHGPQSSQLHHMKMSSSPPGLGGMMDPRDSPPLPHPPTMLHPALLAAAHHGGSPDYGHIRAAMDANDRNSDCNSADITYDGMQQSMSFSNAFLSNFK